MAGRTVSDPFDAVSPVPVEPYALWRDALAEADRVFASPPALGRPVGGCTHCTPESDLLLLGGDPAAVPDDVLGYFTRETAHHWDEDQYPVLWRRLMPRALRSWGPDGHGTEPSLELGHLGAHGAGLTGWPAPERAAVERAFRALLAVALVDGRPAGDVTDLVEGIAHATGGLRPWLDHLAALPGPAADAGLVRLAFSWATDLLWEDFRFSWWYDGDPRVLAAWLPALRPRVAGFAARHPRCKTASDTLIAIDRLDAGDHSPWTYPYGLQEYLRLA
ncbi:hypothetical protein [Streptomyces sp.]|uniref:hypothetical protein n=1 Tax=Streptomyces sp. TaxID=1931 RepID=UPI002811E787|nr:hypothetical protein [Streptomyces sp.]